MTKLSVNINKIATLRNSRGGDIPNVVQAALDCEKFGAEGITVHPRPDERHIRYSDVYDLSGKLSVELNIEGNPTPRFMRLALDVKPAQVTLVPDSADALTSNAGWNTNVYRDFLTDVVNKLRKAGIRSSIFINANMVSVKNAAAIGADRVELYTGPYAHQYAANRDAAIADFIRSAEAAREHGLEINAGHDLSLDNLNYFITQIPYTAEVSIGHALICDALYYGLEETIRLYREQIALATV
jgi:pyridoxine 5-phosphate synthase